VARGAVTGAGWAHRAVLVTAGATFLLLLVGGVVHATDSGLACPDWPQCFGSFFPAMVGKVFFEHGHRLFATGVGILTIVQLVIVWIARPAGHPARWLSVVALLLVIWQGVLGGMTVKMQLPDAVSTAHLATSMLFLSLLILLAFRTRPATVDQPLSPGLRRAIGAAAVLVYVQIVLGALVRHTDSGLACTTLPLCGGVVLPAGADWRIVLHVVHRLGALVAGGAVIAASVAALAASDRNRTVRRLALVAPGLVVAQIALGVMSVLSALEVVIVTAHLGGGALLLVTMVSMSLGARAMDGEVAVRETRDWAVKEGEATA
jgi:heme A synthase